jgi:RNA polymerase sigma-70 factor (ECF subfamily)
MQETSDETLMLAYQKGDAGAFATLYRRHRPRLFRFFVHETSSAAVGEELYQEAWLRVIRAHERYAVQSRFSTWLFAIAHNVLMDHFRKQGRIGRFEEQHDELPDAEDCNLRNPEQQWADSLEARHLQRCLAGLPLEQREAFLLKEEGGFSLEEIADIASVGMETIKSRVRYALKKLRQCLEGSA